MDNQDPSTPLSVGDDPPEAAAEASPAPHEPIAQAYARLAVMTASDYDKVRKFEAASLGVRLVTLDAEVAKRRAEIEGICGLSDALGLRRPSRGLRRSTARRSSAI